MLFQYLSVILDSILILEYMSMDEQLKTAYKQAIQDPCANLDKLSRLTPVLGEDGEPYCIDGSKSVVFKMQDPESGKYYALKCFAEIPDSSEKLRYKLIADELVMVDSPYFVHMRFIEDEIQAEISYPEDRLPVLLMDWVDGETLAEYLAANYQYTFTMSILCYRFCKMAAWLHIQEFAHGDITPSHIMVRPDGTLTLIGYDGMFIPSMKGSLSSALLSSEFCHPKRKIDEFDEHIDDFSLISIALSLKAISLDPSLFDSYGSPERLLFTKEDYCKPEQSKVIASLQQLMYDKEFCSLYSFFMLALVNCNLSLGSLKLFACENPRKLQVDVPEPEKKHRSTSRHKVRYSDDGRKFFGCNYMRCRHYVINEGVRIICDKAFYGWDNLESIEIPSSVEVIGDFEFWRCRVLDKVIIPESVTTLIGNPFHGWNGKLECLSPNFIYEGDVLFNKDKSEIVSFRNQKIESYIIPDSVTSIGDDAFCGCSSLSNIVIPNGVTSIGEGAFMNCSSLSNIVIPNSVISIGDWAFSCCRSLFSIVIPDSVSSIGDCTFSCCRSLSSIVIPDSVFSIGICAFMDCCFLSNFVLPNNVTRIGNGAFLGCSSLSNIVIPDSVSSIGDGAFHGCRLPSNLKQELISRFGDKIF